MELADLIAIPLTIFSFVGIPIIVLTQHDKITSLQVPGKRTVDEKVVLITTSFLLILLITFL